MMTRQLFTKTLWFLLLKGMEIPYSIPKPLQAHNLVVVVMYTIKVSLNLTACKKKMNHTMQFCCGMKSIVFYPTIANSVN